MASNPYEVDATERIKLCCCIYVHVHMSGGKRVMAGTPSLSEGRSFSEQSKRP